MQIESAHYKPLKLNNMKELIIKRVLITPQLASEYLKRNSHNRPLKTRVVKYYAHEMSQGVWRCAAGATIVFDWNGNLQDGQHRLQAIIQSGCNVWMYVILNADPDDFAVIDTGKTRGSGDILALCQTKNANQVSATIKRYMLLNRERTVLHTGSSNVGCDVRGVISNQEVLDIYNQNPEYWQSLPLYGKKISKSRLLPYGFIAGLYAHLHLTKGNDEETIKGFFDGLAGNSTESSIVLLRNKLIEDLAKPVGRKMSAYYRQRIMR